MRAIVLRCLSLAVLGLALAGCPGDGGMPDGGEEPDGGCTAGTVGCACDGTSCTSGECVGGQCVACARGQAGCVCRANGSCDMGLRCGTGSICQTCPAGEAGCPCSGTSCNAGLTCSAQGTCVADTCVPGQVGCPCRSSGTACDGNAVCGGSGRCEACTPDLVGCPCSSTSTCLGGLVCDMDRCRTAVSCQQLRADGGACVPNQRCTEMSGVDAVCVPGQCEPGFKFDARTSTCVACVSVDCAAEPTCGADGGMEAMCLVENRVCEQNGEVATCGACRPGFSQTPQGACVAAPRCGAVTCSLNEYCDTSGPLPACAALPCPPGQARSPAAGGTCTPCVVPATCVGTGYSGRYWPFRTNGGVCVCETLDGYFQPPGGAAVARLCDADSDGWVNENADNGAVTADPALAANSRCAIRRVDRVKLKEETGVTAEVHSCTTGLALHVPPERLVDGGVAPMDGGFPTIPAGGASACGEVVPLRLLESERNDTPGPIPGVKVPAWGSGGRAMEAQDLNSLTKGCVSLTADLNDRGGDDIYEVQPVTAGADQERLQSFSYFIELYRSYYEPGPGPLGALVIEERSRCDVEFPLRYDPNARQGDGGFSDGFSLARDGGGVHYWRACERRRDPAYNQGNVQATGFDFARWTCPAESGTCEFRQFPSAQQVGPTDPATTFFRDFGRCSLGGALPRDSRWRGFGHHSQFKCVNVTGSPSGNTVDLAPGAFGAGNNAHVFNECVAVPCTPGDPASCRSVPGAGPQTATPVLSCTPRTAPLTGQVGFAAVTYRPYGVTAEYTVGQYQGGCIAEDAESAIQSAYLSYLCPFPELSLRREFSDNAFGRHSCYLRPPNFLWSGPVPQRATLRWSGTDGGAALNGVLR